MIEKYWNKWKQIKATDPVKARLLYALFYGGIVVVPFTTGWIYFGLAKVVLSILAVGMTGLAAFFVASIANWSLGWVAHWVYTGQIEWFDVSSTVLDEVESNKYRKKGLPHQKVAPLLEGKIVVSQVVTGNGNITVAESIPRKASKFDDGPDWLSKN